MFLINFQRDLLTKNRSVFFTTKIFRTLLSRYLKLKTTNAIQGVADNLKHQSLVQFIMVKFKFNGIKKQVIKLIPAYCTCKRCKTYIGAADLT